eukprot:6751389-Pyramimonas_sp.AAC.1
MSDWALCRGFCAPGRSAEAPERPSALRRLMSAWALRGGFRVPECSEASAKREHRLFARPQH